MSLFLYKRISEFFLCIKFKSKILREAFEKCDPVSSFVAVLQGGIGNGVPITTSVSPNDEHG